MDLGIDEVTQISTIIQEAAGDEAEIIFGAVHDPELDQQIRVTVIATGFDTEVEQGVLRPDFRRPAVPTRTAEVRSQPQVQRQVAMGGGAPTPIGGGTSGPGVTPPSPPTPRAHMGQMTHMAPAPLPMSSLEDVRELDIPTFIRRRYD
jgi:cell division protein FtsZ